MSTTVRLLCALLASAFLIGCAVAIVPPPRMRVDPALAEVSPLAVKRDKQQPGQAVKPIAFGPWSTQSPALLSWNFPPPALEGPYAVAKFRFAMSGAAPALQIECVAREFDLIVRYNEYIRRQGRAGGYAKVPTLSCNFRASGPGTLMLSETTGLRETGEITFGSQSWTIDSVHIERPRFESAGVGYEISRGGTVIAAVEIVGAGRVWLAPVLTELERARVAVLVPALIEAYTYRNELRKGAFQEIPIIQSTLQSRR